VAVFREQGPQPYRSSAMTNSGSFRITLTAEQKEQVRRATGKEAEVVELSIEELEERIAPMTAKNTMYHNRPL
jgi:hypothetical protein